MQQVIYNSDKKKFFPGQIIGLLELQVCKNVIKCLCFLSDRNRNIAFACEIVIALQVTGADFSLCPDGMISCRIQSYSCTSNQYHGTQWRPGEGRTSDCTIWQLIATIATDCETRDSLMVEIDRSEIDQIVAPFCTIATDWKIRSQ